VTSNSVLLFLEESRKPYEKKLHLQKFLESQVHTV